MLRIKLFLWKTRTRKGGQKNDPYVPRESGVVHGVPHQSGQGEDHRTLLPGAEGWILLSRGQILRGSAHDDRYPGTTHREDETVHGLRPREGKTPRPTSKPRDELAEPR